MASDVGIDQAGCEANPYDIRCSCYNVLYKDCDVNTNLPGCGESNDWKSTILSLIPEGTEFDSQRELASREIGFRSHCGSTVCSEDKYRPPLYQDIERVGRCDFQLNICASEVNVGESINAKYFRDCSLNQTDIVDLDSVYAQDPSVQSILGLRTGENAALIAAKNKQLQLELRKIERQEEIKRQAEVDDDTTNKIKKIEEIKDVYEEQKINKIKLIILVTIILIVVVVGILNL
jgi:hypothetical protein